MIFGKDRLATALHGLRMPSSSSFFDRTTFFFPLCKQAIAVRFTVRGIRWGTTTCGTAIPENMDLDLETGERNSYL